MTVRFDLRAALDLAEHADAAPHHLYQPNRASGRGEAALTLGISDTVYLLSAGLPSPHTSAGVLRYVVAEPDSVDFGVWCTRPYPVVDPKQIVSAAVRGQLHELALPFLPLHRPADRPVIELIRAAARAGYTHITIDLADLSVGVMRRRWSTRTPVRG